MEINKSELNINKKIDIDEIFEFSEENFKQAGIINAKNIKFVGNLFYNLADEIKLEGTLSGELILEDAVDLSEFLYKIDIKIDKIIENCENTLDINEILWENIVLEVPIRATNKELGSLKGSGWKVINEDEKSEDEIDPRLAKLQELFKGGE